MNEKGSRALKADVIAYMKKNNCFIFLTTINQSVTLYFIA